MSSLGAWKVPAASQPKPGDYSFDLDAALTSVVAVKSVVPGDAFTAETLGTERAGYGVFVRDGIVLTIGYLITEAESIWLTLHDGRSVPGHVLGYDNESGFGLVQVLSRLDVPALPLGRSAAVQIGERVVLGAAGGRQRSVAARVVAKQEFAGYWEYVLDEAIFTAPAHPHWGGTAAIGPAGELLGIGSLQLQAGESGEHLNMVVPIDLLTPVFDDLITLGRPNRPVRPWLGFYATEIEDGIAIIGIADGGPADKADLRTGDLLLAVADTEVSSLAELFRRIWSLGTAGVDVPFRILRDGRTLDVHVTSSDRSRFFKKPRIH